MYVSMRWLARHVDLDGITPEQLGRIVLQLVDAETRDPIDGALVTLTTLNRRVLSDSTGQALFQDIPPGAHVALAVGHGRLGPRRAAARHTVRSVQGRGERPRACAPCPARDPRLRGRQPRPSCSSRPLAACTSGTCPGSGAPRGVRGAPHGPPRCGATRAQAEHVRAGTRGGALRGPETHPVTTRTLGARVVGVLGHPPGA